MDFLHYVDAARWRKRFKEDDGFCHALAGAGSGLIAAVIVTPLDVTKVRLQNQVILTSPTLSGGAPRNYTPSSPPPPPKYRGTLPTLKLIWREEGLRGLFSGLTPSVLAYLPDRAIWFSMYHECKVAFGAAVGPAYQGTPVHLAASLVASVMCTIVVTPLWFLRTRMMTQVPDGSHAFQYRSTAETFATILRKEGVLAFYKGLGPSLLGVSHSLVMFPLYERLKLILYEYESQHGHLKPDGGISNLAILTASSLSKCVAGLVTYPHEVLRTRMQTQTTLTHLPSEEAFGGHVKVVIRPKYDGIVNTARIIIAEEGMKSMYRGLPTSLIRQVPSGAISLWIYEVLYKTMRHS
ncbi:mitochondrial carrier domain-containing protein [Zopfochytrium polystomum]|nr:mitochondrial carrier domain-containing protein [Zopfochytrium polystomum]